MKDKAASATTAIIVLFFMVVVFFAFLLGTRQPSPAIQIANLRQAIGSLASSKAACEGRASYAKRNPVRGGAKRLNDSYSDVVGIHNGLINEFIAAVQLQKSGMSEAEVASRLGEVLSKAEAFQKLYDRTYPPQKTSFGSENPLGFDVNAVLAEIARIQNARDEQERAAARNLLESCKMREWSTIP